MEFPTLELDGFFLQDAAALVAARDKALLIHHTKDISTAGAEIEVAVRDSLKRRLPNGCHVTHGHVIDAFLHTSPQLDVIVADSNATPVLFRAENGAEYLPIESVYAIGEIKSTYYKSDDPIQSFSSTVKNLKDEFRREKAPPTYLQTGGRGLEIEGVEQSDKLFQNPMLFFMLFINSGDFSPEEFSRVYRNIDVKHLPSIVCLLDKGLILFGSTTEKGFGFVRCPEAEPEISEKQDWVLMPMGDDTPNIGSHYGFLCYALLAHIQDSVLMPPDMQTYLWQMFIGRSSKTIHLKDVEPNYDEMA